MTVITLKYLYTFVTTNLFQAIKSVYTAAGFHHYKVMCDTKIHHRDVSTDDGDDSASTEFLTEVPSACKYCAMLDTLSIILSYSS